jgi:hypothetical protein
VSKPIQQIGIIDNLIGNHMRDRAFALQFAAHMQEPSGHHLFAELLKDLRPDHNIRNGRIILKGQKDNPARGPRPLARDDQT